MIRLIIYLICTRFDSYHAALWILDYVLTLPMEIEAIWLRKKTGSGVLFLLNRYSMMVACALQFYGNFASETDTRYACRQGSSITRC